MNACLPFLISACECDLVGSLSPLCSDSGQCSCKPGVGGPTCNDCLPDFFNFTSEGCRSCDCSQFSTSLSCDVTTGQCPCPERASGRTCDSCVPNFFNLTTQGCQACDCDAAGSVDGSCDAITGQCVCTGGGGLSGLRCDQCAQGFFNTGRGGPTETCARCVCSGRSTDCSLSSAEESTSLSAVQFDFTQLCPADPITCGDGWRVLTDDLTEIFFGPKSVKNESTFYI